MRTRGSASAAAAAVAAAGLVAAAAPAGPAAEPGPVVAPGAPSSTTSGPVGATEGGDTLVVGDDMERTVRIGATPERIVSLVPPFTEILFGLGAGDRVVGRTRYGDHPPEARDVPSVGEGMRPSLELVRAREPDLVLLFAGSANRSTVERLEELGTPALAFRHDGIDDLERNVRRMGRLTGREAEARAMVDRIRCGLDAVARATSGVEPVRVYYEVWSDPPVTVGTGSYLDTLLTVAGGRNVFDDLESPSPRVSLEAVTERRPDAVVMSELGGGGGQRTPPSERPGWSELEAVAEGRVYRVDGDLVHRLGPRLGEAAAELASRLHPGIEARVRDELASSCDEPPAGRR